MRIFNFSVRAIMVAVVLAILAFSSTAAFARDFDRGGRGGGRPGGRYFFSGGRWYHPGWFGINFVVDVPPVGGYVDVLPPGYAAVYVGGARYYYSDNVYYEPYPPGYLVVQPPTTAPVVVQSQIPSYIVNIPNFRRDFHCRETG